MRPFIVSIVFFALMSVSNSMFGQLTTEFTYQGTLHDGGVASNGLYDFQFRLYDAENNGTAIGNAISKTLSVSDGVFTAALDFSAAAYGNDQRWLEISVRLSGQGGYTTLLPRQKITNAPYALKAQSVTANSVGSTELAQGSVQGEDVDPSSVQLRVVGTCASGKAVRGILSNGGVTCETVSPTGSDWVDSGDGRILSSKGVLISPNPAANLPFTISHDSGINSPHISLLEAQNDYARLTFRNSVNTGRAWTIAGQVATDVANDRINFYNSGANGGGADIMTIKGNRHVGINTTSPAAPLHVYQFGNWAPGQGAGQGDFHIGNGTNGLRIGVAPAGGGAGTTRFWTNSQRAMIFGTTTTDVMIVGAVDNRVGIGTLSPQQRFHVSGGKVRFDDLAHAGPDNRTVVVEPDGDLVLGSGGAGGGISLASEFGVFGGDGSMGVYTSSAQLTGGQFNRGGQFTQLTLSNGGGITAERLFIAVQGRCTIDGTITARGGNYRPVYFFPDSGVPGQAFVGSSGYNPFGRENRQAIYSCASGSGGAGGGVLGPYGFTPGGDGGGASELGGESPNGVFDGGSNPLVLESLLGYRNLSSQYSQLLQCVGGGGGGPALLDIVGDGNSTGIPVLCGGGAGGGVIYLECGELDFAPTGVIDVSGQDGVSCPNNLGDDDYIGGTGGGGGGIVVIRARQIIRNEGTIITDGGNGGLKTNGNPGYQAENGGDGGRGWGVIIDLP